MEKNGGIRSLEFAPIIIRSHGKIGVNQEFKRLAITFSYIAIAIFHFTTDGQPRRFNETRFTCESGGTGVRYS